MGIGKTITFFLIFFFCISFVFSIDDVDKVYFTQQQEKLANQFNQKVDAKVNGLSTELKTSVETAKTDILNIMTVEIKSSLRSVAIGLAGLIIITLAVFKVIDLKISSTRNIKKYEKLLNEKTEQLNQLILQATIERSELNNSRVQLADYQKRLVAWNKQIETQQQQVNLVYTQMGQQPMYQPQQFNPQVQSNNLQQPFRVQPPPQTYPTYFPSPPTATPPEQKKGGWKSVVTIILLILAIALIGLTVYKFFILG